MTRNPETLCRTLGLQFNDPRLLTLALTHRSAGVKNNERLEFLGDSVLGFVIAKELVEKFPKASEGVLSRLRAGLVNQESLAEIAREHELGHYLIMGSGELKSGGFRRDSILSDALEAIIGAVLKDRGIEYCCAWVLEIFGKKLDLLSLDSWEKDPKTQLQEYMQAKRLELPEYTLISQTGLPHSQTFTVECRVSLFAGSCTGMGSSRKKAEQEAAEKMLAELSMDEEEK
ncbi:MAG: ribonuclease III [Gammaproteobacteria bacterium]